jgi:hypothetical protein
MYRIRLHLLVWSLYSSFYHHGLELLQFSDTDNSQSSELHDLHGLLGGLSNLLGVTPSIL